MKFLFFILTLVLHLCIVFAFKYLDNIMGLIVLQVAATVIGGILNFSADDEKSLQKNVGWGLFYGSLTVLALGVCVLFYLAGSLR